MCFIYPYGQVRLFLMSENRGWEIDSVGIMVFGCIEYVGYISVCVACLPLII